MLKALLKVSSAYALLTVELRQASVKGAAKGDLRPGRLTSVQVSGPKTPPHLRNPVLDGRPDQWGHCS